MMSFQSLRFDLQVDVIVSNQIHNDFLAQIRRPSSIRDQDLLSPWRLRIDWLEMKTLRL